MLPVDMLRTQIDPGLKFMVVQTQVASLISSESRVLLLAIAGQEGGFKDRRQIQGPARSYVMFEHNGGLAAVLQSHVTSPWIEKVCKAIDVPFVSNDIFEAMAWNDNLWVALGRSLLYLVPAKLPELGQLEAAYMYYKNQWRPGKEHRQDWPTNYAKAMDAVSTTPI